MHFLLYFLKEKKISLRKEEEENIYFKKVNEILYINSLKIHFNY